MAERCEKLHVFSKGFVILWQLGSAMAIFGVRNLGRLTCCLVTSSWVTVLVAKRWARRAITGETTDVSLLAMG
jgi:hypothetical protein